MINQDKILVFLEYVRSAQYLSIGIGGHESTAVLLLGTFELFNLIVIKKLFLKFFFIFIFELHYF